VNDFITRKEAASYKHTPWVEAVEERLKLLSFLSNLGSRGHMKYYSDQGFNWGKELEVLKIAEDFSFSGPGLAAIKQAMVHIPSESSFGIESIPGTGQCWWYFDEPLECPTTKTHTHVHALLLSVNVKLQPSDLPALKKIGEMYQLELEATSGAVLEVSAYSRDSELGDMLTPTTSWLWTLGTSIESLVGRANASYDLAYGKGGRFREKYTDDQLFGKEKTVAAVEFLSRFILASCIWMSQEIVEQSTGHVERHLGKRLQREHKLSNRPTGVKVIALRRRAARHGTDVEPSSESSREYSVQWVVGGHWRNQPHGPGRSARKLVYINPYIKGPEDKPLKEVTFKKVFAVMR